MFQVQQSEEMINKTFRLPANLLEKLAKIADAEKSRSTIWYGSVVNMHWEI